MADVVDLRPDQLATVQTILAAHVPNAEVWAFGSRAKWTAKDTSDLDLAVVSEKPISPTTLDKLRRAFEESYLPIKVDVVDFARISEEFRNVIRKQKVVLRKPVSSDGATRAEWRTLPLEECVETIIDYRGKTPRKVPSGIPLITAKVVKGGRIETPDEFIAAEDYEGWMRRGIPRAGDVLLTMEAPLGEVAQLDDRKVALAQRLVALRGKPGVLDNSFLKYLLQSDLIQEQLKARATGTTVLGIKQSELRKINLLLPPPDEQRAIARILKALDDQIELSRRVNETIESIVRTLFEHWFVNVTEDGSPKGWRYADLSEIAEVIDCLHSKKPERQATGKPLLQLNNIRDDGLIDMTDTYLISEEDYQFWISRIEASPGDCVITNVGRVAATAQIPAGLHAALGRNMTAVRCRASFPYPTFLLECLRSSAMKEEIGLKTDSGTILDALNVRNIPTLKFLKPTNEAAARFETICRPLRAKMEQNLAESRMLSELRDALLPKILSGEMKVPERSLESGR